MRPSNKEVRIQPEPKLRLGIQATLLGIANGTGKTNHPLGKTWQGMIERCYSKTSPAYKNYGAKGVYVCNDWLEFKVFAEQVSRLPNWDLKLTSEKHMVQLDKDKLGDGYCYSLETCCWLSTQENTIQMLDKVIVLIKDNVEYKFTNISSFCREHNLERTSLKDLWSNKFPHMKGKAIRQGFKFLRFEEPDG